MSERIYSVELTPAELEEIMLKNYTSVIDDLLNSYGFDEDDCLDFEQVTLAHDLLSIASALAYREELPKEMGRMLIGRLAYFTDYIMICDVIATCLKLSSKGYEEMPDDLYSAFCSDVCDEEIVKLIPAMSESEVLSTVLFIADQVTDGVEDFAGPLFQAIYDYETVLPEYLLTTMAANLFCEFDEDEDCAGCDGCFGEECECFETCEGCDNCEEDDEDEDSEELE